MQLVIEWLLWLPYKSRLVNFDIAETLKDSPNTPPSLKFFEQRFHKLRGGGGGLVSLDNVVGSKRRRRSRRVNPSYTKN